MIRLSFGTISTILSVLIIKLRWVLQNFSEFKSSSIFTKEMRITNFSFELLHQQVMNNKKFINIFEEVGAQFSSSVSRESTSISIRFISSDENITIEILKEKKIIPNKSKNVKVFMSGDLKTKINLKGIKVTSGVKKVIEELGGKITD